MQCQNPACGLRFPLDRSQFKGIYCLRCGGDLLPVVPALPQSQPITSSPAHSQGLIGILDNIRSVQNVGAIFRTADGAGLQKLWLCGITSTPASNPQISKTALGAEQSLPWESAPNALTLVQALKSQGFLILSLEVTPQAILLFNYKLPKVAQPIALVVGSEPAGVDPDVLALSDATLFLPMSGSKGSLNVAVAFGIAAYYLQFGN